MRQIHRLGTHLLIELAGCEAEFLNNEEQVSEALLQAAVEAKATILSSYFHKFHPQGVSGVVVIAESHLSIHTWPELEYAAIDIFTCGDRVMPFVALRYILKKFEHDRYQTVEIGRGYPKANATNKFELVASG
jgi:S-adenosylmethionine decarboxylase